MNIGIDKIQLKVKEVGLSRQLNHQRLNGWSKSNTWLQLDDGLVLSKALFFADQCLDHNGQPMYGHHNGNLTIEDKPLEDTTSILFNPTNFFSDYKLTTNVKEAINKAQDIVWNAGLDIDLSCAEIRRIDVAKDRVLTEPVQRYATPLTNFLHFRRQSKKMGYDDGWTMGNNSRQFTFYDKKLKLDLDKVQNDLRNNTARLEYKLMNKGREYWAKSYGIYTPKDLTNDVDQYNQIYQDGLRQLMFKNVLDGDTIDLSPITLINQLKDYHRVYGRNFQDYYEKDFGRLGLNATFGIDAYIDAVAQVGNSNVKEVRRKVRKGLANAMKFSQSTKDVRRPVEYVQEIFNEYAQAC